MYTKNEALFGSRFGNSHAPRQHPDTSLNSRGNNNSQLESQPEDIDNQNIPPTSSTERQYKLMKEKLRRNLGIFSGSGHGDEGIPDKIPDCLPSKRDQPEMDLSLGTTPLAFHFASFFSCQPNISNTSQLLPPLLALPPARVGTARHPVHHRQDLSLTT